MSEKEFLKIAKYLKSVISNTDFENHLYAVGGCVRDFLMKREIHDIDLVLDIPHGGIDFAKFLNDNELLTHAPIIYENFGTVMFNLKEFPEIELEAVHTRKETYRDKNSRNPETAFGTIEEDSQRRDFTYNALYYNITDEEIIDINGFSISDLNENILRTCGDPDIIFTEDPLRILRAIRFSCRFGSSIDMNTLEGMKKYSSRLSIISKERICDEFSKIITSNDPDYGVNLMKTTGAMNVVFPEYYDAQEYYLLDSNDNSIEMRLALFIYPWCRDSKKLYKILFDLKYPINVINKVIFIIEKSSLVSENIIDLRKLQYACSYYNNIEPSEVRKLFNTVVYFYTTVHHYFEYLNKLIENIVNGLDYSGTSMWYYKLPVDGVDVIEILGCKPGPIVKKILSELLEEAFKNPNIDRKFCIEHAKKNGKA